MSKKVEEPASSGELLKEALLARMPFGRHKGQRLMDLPFGYLCWFQRQGWPRGKLGAQLATIYELQHNDYPLLCELRAVVRPNEQT